MKKDPVQLVEGALYIAGRPINIEALKKLAEVPDTATIQNYIATLREKLVARESFLEIVKIENDFWMRVKPEKKEELGNLNIKKSLSEELMKVLSYVAIRQPIKMTELRKVVPGKKTSETVKLLERQGFLKVQPVKRAKYIITTPRFASVFNLDPDNLKESLMKMLKQRMAQRLKAPLEEELKKVEKKRKTKMTKEEKEEIERRYRELIAKLEKEREEERKYQEELERKLAEEEALKAQLEVDPFAGLMKGTSPPVAPEAPPASEQLQDQEGREEIKQPETPPESEPPPEDSNVQEEMPEEQE